MSKKVLLLFSSGLFFFFFIFFSYLVDKNVFRQVDFDITVRLQDDIPRRLDNPFSFFSLIGSFEVSTLLLFTLVGIFVFRKQLFALLWVGVYAVFHLIEIFGKTIVENVPPPEFLLRTQRLVQFDPYHVRTEFSYPSGHSGRTFFLVTILLCLVWQAKIPLMFKLGATVILGGYVFVMLLSRIYLGEHWITDVIGGMLLGIACGLMSVFFVSFTIPYRKIYHRLLSK